MLKSGGYRDVLGMVVCQVVLRWKTLLVIKERKEGARSLLKVGRVVGRYFGEYSGVVYIWG